MAANTDVRALRRNGADRPLQGPPAPASASVHTCREPFIARVGTLFESGHVPIRYWLHAIYLMSSNSRLLQDQADRRSRGWCGVGASFGERSAQSSRSRTDASQDRRQTCVRRGWPRWIVSTGRSPVHRGEEQDRRTREKPAAPAAKEGFVAARPWACRAVPPSRSRAAPPLPSSCRASCDRTPMRRSPERLLVIPRVPPPPGASCP